MRRLLSFGHQHLQTFGTNAMYPRLFLLGERLVMPTSAPYQQILGLPTQFRLSYPQRTTGLRLKSMTIIKIHGARQLVTGRLIRLLPVLRLSV